MLVVNMAVQALDRHWAAIYIARSRLGIVVTAGSLLETPTLDSMCPQPCLAANVTTKHLRSFEKIRPCLHRRQTLKPWCMLSMGDCSMQQP